LVGWLVGCRNHARIETPGICHQPLITAPRIDDLGLGELPVDSTQDRALADLLCAGNGVRLKPGESGRWRDGSGTGSGCRGVACHRQGIVWYCSGDRLGGWVRVRSCWAFSSVLRAFPGLRLAALIHSRSLVLVLVLVVGWWLVDATICATDMHCRYALPIWCDDMQGRKTEKAKSNTLLAPDVVYFCDSLLLFDPLNYFTHISGDDSSNEVFKLY